MISKEEVLHIAKLARLQLTEKELEKMQKDMSAILDYFDLLKKAPGVEITRESTIYSALREDEIAKKDDSEAKKLLEDAPGKKDDYIKVKAIL